MSDQEIRLRITKAGDGAAQAAADLNAVAGSGEKAQDALGRFVKTGDAADTSMEALSHSAERAALAVHKVDTATVQTSKGTANFGRVGLETGRIIQDGFQGGLGGVINNIEGFSLAVGLGSGAAGALTILGVVALAVGPQVKGVFNAIRDGSNAVPQATNELDKLTNALKSNGETLDELRKKQSLTNTELATFNRLTAETAALEKRLEAEKAAGALAKRVNALTDPASAEAAKERANALAGTFGGKTDALKRAARGAALADNPEVAAADERYRAALEDEQTAIANRVLFTDTDRANFGREAEKLRVAAQEARAKITKAADAVVDRAVGLGDANALDVLTGAAGRRPDLFDADQRKGLNRAADAPGRAAADAERTAEGKRIQEESDRAEKARIAEEVRTMNAESKANADIWDDKVKAKKDRERFDDANEKTQQGIVEAARQAAQRRIVEKAGQVSDNTMIDERALELSANGVGQQQIARMAAVDVQRANPGMGRDEAQAVAAKIAEDQTAKALEMYANAQMRASEMGLRGADLNNAAIQDVLIGVRGLMARQEQVIQNARWGAKHARGFRNDVGGLQPADMGRWGGG